MSLRHRSSTPAGVVSRGKTVGGDTVVEGEATDRVADPSVATGSPRRRASPSVAIIGAGLGGIAAAVHLKRAGVDSFTIFEQSAGPGGTWWDNTYPGAECDIPIAFYSYSFMPHDWIRTHASQAEIQEYIRLVIVKFGLEPHIRYNTRVAEAVWSEDRHSHTVRTSSGVMYFDVVVSALGLLNVPRYPTWPGLESFKGPKFHTARWEHQHDLQHKRVAVVGTGSTAAQVVPAIAPIVTKLKMFSREPAFVLPKEVRALTPSERRRGGSGLWRRWQRLKLFIQVEKSVSWRNPRSGAQRDKRHSYKQYVDTLFADRSDLQSVLMPDYPFACKRPVLSSDLFPALKRDNVELVSRAVTAVTEDGVIDSGGDEHKIDVLVMATGFQPWNFLSNLELLGRGGRSIHGVWGEEPEAYLGIQVPGFPNFFMMYGPNTNYFCVTFMLEQQARYITKSVIRMARNRDTAIEVRPTFMSFYNERLQKSLSGKVLEANCNNYYHTSTGRNVVTYPWRGAVYWLLCRLSRLSTFTYRLSGEQKKHIDPTRRTINARSNASADSAITEVAA
jgi:cation diffusion facilitator CzcD-associated flavoprotein CzcO